MISKITNSGATKSPKPSTVIKLHSEYSDGITELAA